MVTIHKISIWVSKHFELFCWVAAIFALYLMPVDTNAPSLCLFRTLGFGKCPGCGMGHALHFALRGNLAASIKQHPLGIFALLMILNRIRQLIIQLKTP